MRFMYIRINRNIDCAKSHGGNTNLTLCVALLMITVFNSPILSQSKTLAADCAATHDYVHDVGQIDMQPNGAEVFALQSWNNRLYAGGFFTRIDTNTTQESVAHIAMWDGTTWSAVGTSNVGPQGISDRVYALTPYQNSLYIGGNISSIGPDTNCVDDQHVDFVRHIATWNGIGWSPLLQSIGTSCRTLGPTGIVRTFLTYDFGVNVGPNDEITGSTLFIGGDFGAIKLPNPDPTNSITIQPRWGAVVAWNGSAYQRVAWPVMQFDVTNQSPGSVRALAVFDDGQGVKLYAAGHFNRAYNCDLDDPSCTSYVEVRNIAALDMQTGLWSSVGGAYKITGSSSSTPVGEIRALQVFDDGTGPELYAGGDFNEVTDCRTNISQCPVYKYRFANGIARFDGMRWQAIGGPAIDEFRNSQGDVHSLAVYDVGAGKRLFAGGKFPLVKISTADDSTAAAKSIAQFDGTSWSALSGGGISHGVNLLSLVNALTSHTYNAQRPLLYLGGRFDQTGVIFESPPPANLAAKNVVAWGLPSTTLDSDNDTFIDICDNCPFTLNVDQSDSDGDGQGDICDACPTMATTSTTDINCNNTPDACEPPSIDTPTLITDSTGLVLWTLVYDTNCPLRLIKKYRGTINDHIMAASYCYDVDGRLERICQRDTTNTSSADADASCNQCNRGQEIIYDPAYPERVVGSRNFKGNCSCSPGSSFTYRDALDRVEYITTSQQSSSIRPYGTILEQFIYDQNSDRVIDHFKRQPDGSLTLLSHYTYTDNITTCIGGTLINGGYEVLIQSPINSSQSQMKRQCYDDSNRLVETCEYDELFVSIAFDTGLAVPIVTKHLYTFIESNNSISFERNETIHPSGYKDVRQWQLTSGTINTSGSLTTASSFRESVSGLRINVRTEVSFFNVTLNRYRLNHIIEPTGNQTTFQYSPTYRDAVTMKNFDLPGGISTYGQSSVQSVYNLSDAGRMTQQENLGPLGPVTTAFEYDAFGRLSKTIQNATGPADEQIETRYIYNAFDELVLTGRALEPGPEPLKQLVEASVYDTAGRVKSEIMCEWSGTLSIATFDSQAPPCQLFQQRDYSYDTTHGQLIEESDIYSDQAPFDYYFIPIIAPRKLTHHVYDDTGQWRLASGVEATGPPTGDSFDWIEYDNQGRISRTRHATLPNGVRPISQIIYNGRGLPTSSIQSSEIANGGPTTTTTYNADGFIASVQQSDGSYQIFEYDEFGRVQFQRRCDMLDCTGQFNIVTSFTYDSASQITQTSVSNVSLTQTDYDNVGRPFRIRQRSNLLTPGNSEDKVTLRQYNPDSSVARVALKINNDPTQIDDTTDLVTVNTFDNLGRLLQVRKTNDDYDEITDYTYDFSGNRKTTRRRLNDLPNDAIDLIVRQEYNALGQATKIIDPEGHYTSMVFDGFGRRVLSIAYQDGDGDGVGGIPLRQHRTEYFYHGGPSTQATMSNASAAFFMSASPISDRMTAFGYGPGYRPTDSSRYNTNTNTSLQTNRTYDNLGRPLSITDPIGNVTTQSYDSSTGQVISTNNIGNTLDNNDVKSSASMASMTFTFDGLGRRSQTSQHPATGTPVGDQSPLSSFVTYDDANRQRTVTDLNNITSKFDYDQLGRLTNSTEALGTPIERSTARSYDRLGRLLSVETTDAGQSQRTQYEYDRLGRRTKTIYPDSVNPTLDSVEIEYDRAGRMIRRTDQRGQIVEYSYDKKGLLRFKNACVAGAPPCSPALQDEFTYDGLGRMTTAIRRDGSPLLEVSRVDFAYNDLSYLISETQRIIGLPSKTIFYTRDQLGNRMSLDCPGVVSACLDYDYDEVNRTTSIDRDQQPLAKYVYEWTNQLKRRYTIIPSSTSPITYNIDYDTFRRPYAYSNRTNWPSGPIITQHDVTSFSPTGNPLASTSKISNASNSVDIFAADLTHTYDDLNRLNSTSYANTIGANAGTQTFDLDALGNRNTLTDTRDVPTRTTTYGQNNFANEYSHISLLNGANGPLSYDSAGNLTLDEQGFQYDYDHDNHLIEVRDQAGFMLATYAYDALGRRILQEKDGQTTIFYYDGQNVLAEFDDTDTRLRYYTHGSTYVDEHILFHEDGPTDPEDNESYYLLGPNYSVVGLADDTGRVFEAYDYDSFGNVTKTNRTTGTKQTNSDLFPDGLLDDKDAAQFALLFGNSGVSSVLADFVDDDVVDFLDWQYWFEAYQDFQNNATSNPYYFTGRRLDFNLTDESDNPILSLYHYRARAYNALQGRFLQRDPAGYVDGMNLYEAFKSDPTYWVDPTGLKNWNAYFNDRQKHGAWYAGFWDLLGWYDATPVGDDYEDLIRQLQNRKQPIVGVANGLGAGLEFIAGFNDGADFALVVDEWLEGKFRVTQLATLLPFIGRGNLKILDRCGNVVKIIRGKDAKFLSTIRPVKEIRKLLRGATKGKIEVHHLIEKRFADRLGISNVDDIEGVLVDQLLHRGAGPESITQALRLAIPHQTGNSSTKYINYTVQEILEAHERVYKDLGIPEVMDAIKHWFDGRL